MELMSRWRKNWTLIPEYKKIVAAAISLWVVVAGVYVSFVLAEILQSPWVIFAATLVLLSWWLVLCIDAIRQFKTVEGVFLVAMLHITHALFVVGALGTACSAAMFFFGLFFALDGGLTSLPIMGIAVVTFLIWGPMLAAAPKLDRYIGRSCIRRWLQRQGMS